MSCLEGGPLYGIYGDTVSCGTPSSPLFKWTPLITTPTGFILRSTLYYAQMGNFAVRQTTQENRNTRGVKWTHYSMLKKHEGQKHTKEKRSRGGKLMARGINENLRQFEDRLSHKCDVCPTQQVSRWAQKCMCGTLSVYSTLWGPYIHCRMLLRHPHRLLHNCQKPQHAVYHPL